MHACTCTLLSDDTTTRSPYLHLLLLLKSVRHELEVAPTDGCFFVAPLRHGRAVTLYPSES
jgi:hypothetical protein